nr:MAG TPA: hypothetical protein [Caudoviricetes sp.]
MYFLRICNLIKLFLLIKLRFEKIFLLCNLGF